MLDKRLDDSEILFDEQSHTYTDLEGNEYISVTQLISQYKPKFDADYWSLVKSKKEGITQAEMLERWKKKSQNAITNGRKKHLALEEFFKNEDKSVYRDGNWQVEFGELVKQIDAYFIDYTLPRKTTKVTLLSEQRIHSPLHRVAGTIDFALHFTNTDAIHIFDFKTGTLKYESPSHMLGCCKNLPNCNYFHYTIQLGIYARMLRLKGFKVKIMRIIHIDEEDKITIIPVSDLSNCDDILASRFKLVNGNGVH